MDGESVLGPIPHPWKVRMGKNEGGIYVPRYWDKETDTITQDDPRLDSLSPDWERIPREWTRDSPVVAAWHKNKVTRETMNSDPRMLPDALVARGVKLEQFRLV